MSKEEILSIAQSLTNAELESVKSILVVFQEKQADILQVLKANPQHKATIESAYRVITRMKGSIHRYANDLNSGINDESDIEKMVMSNQQLQSNWTKHQDSWMKIMNVLYVNAALLNRQIADIYKFKEIKSQFL